MNRVFVASHNIISPLGATSEANFDAVSLGNSGIHRHSDSRIDTETFWAAMIDDASYKSFTAAIPGNFSKFERLLLASVSNALDSNPIKADITSPGTIFIVSTTKGNIDLLDGGTTNPRDLSLAASAEKVTEYFGNPNTPIVVSNACISGVQALIIGKRLLESGRYTAAIVTGADLISRFVLSGFKSFQALSPGRCKPFSADRDGINLGEGAATVILTTKNTGLEVLGGASTNDSNHISGPSRTGKELAEAIALCLTESGIQPEDIGFISAHGTATPFNDEMEAKAFGLSGMGKVPVNSLKGYFGHTLGASGLVESVISLVSLQKSIVVASAGYRTPAVSENITICETNINKTMKYCLKTASGFGGCNSAVIFSKS